MCHYKGDIIHLTATVWSQEIALNVKIKAGTSETGAQRKDSFYRKAKTALQKQVFGFRER